MSSGSWLNNDSNKLEPVKKEQSRLADKQTTYAQFSKLLAANGQNNKQIKEN